MREVKLLLERIPDCDLCPNPKFKAIYNTPTKQGPWANLCQRHMDSIGIMTSVTEKFLVEALPPRRQNLRAAKVEAARRNKRMFGTDPSWYGLTDDDIR